MFQHHIAQLNRRYFDYAASNCVASSTIFILFFGLWLLLWIRSTLMLMRFCHRSFGDELYRGGPSKAS